MYRLEEADLMSGYYRVIYELINTDILETHFMAIVNTIVTRSHRDSQRVTQNQKEYIGSPPSFFFHIEFMTPLSESLWAF